MKKFCLLISSVVLATLLLVSCSDDDSSGSGQYGNGAFILNEGAYGNANASVSFIDFSTNLVENDIFSAVNGRPVGDVLQGAAISRGKIYMVLNNSGKVEVANSADFTQVATIEGLVNPRCVTVVNGKIYVTQWGNWGEKGSLMVYGSDTYSLSKTIQLGKGSEGIIYSDGRLWIANGGGYELDSTVMVVNLSTNEIVDTVTVGYNPKELVADNDGNIWVVCYGYIEYDDSWNVSRELPSMLVKINSDNFQVDKRFVISDTMHPSHIDVSPSGETIYYGGGYGFNGIFGVGISDNQLPATAVVDGSFYGFNVNPYNGAIYGLVAPDFVNAGKLYVYSPDGTMMNEFEVGIAPNTAVFN